jgi:predicted DsbA family dithiol-disulfide isomerase
LPAHIAGKAVARQGSALFAAFHLEAMRAFFGLSQNLQDPKVLRQIAATVGADLKLFDQDMADPELKEVVWREFTLGVEQDRVTAIPTMFVGKRVVEGALSLDRYRQLFDAVLKG